MAEHLSSRVSPTFAAQLRAACAEARSLRDPDSLVTWRVYELPPGPYDRRATSALVFEHEWAVRRVREYPSDWRALDDAALLALSDRRGRV